VNGLTGWDAEASFFVYAPHGTMVIRFTAPKPANKRLFLMCTGCRHIAMADHWTVDDLRVSPHGSSSIIEDAQVQTLRVSPHDSSSLIIEDAKNGMCIHYLSLIIEDAKNGMCIHCDGARLFEEDQYRGWLGGDQNDVDLTPGSGRQLLMRALES